MGRVWVREVGISFCIKKFNLIEVFVLGPTESTSILQGSITEITMFDREWRQESVVQEEGIKLQAPRPLLKYRADS